MALYLTTLAISLLIAGMGLMLIASQRSNRELQDNMKRENQAWWCARSGVELACTYMEQVSDWRQRVTNNVLLDAVTVGDAGTCRVEVYDDCDNNVADDSSEPVRIISTGQHNDSSYRLQISLRPQPHPALGYAAFGTTSDDMEFNTTCTIKGPVRSHGAIRSAFGVHPLAGATFETMSGYTIQDPLTPKSFATTAIPAPQVNLATYLAMATPITGSNGAPCLMKGYNLTPTRNPCGAANTNGMYSFDAGGREVIIENIHIRGTLIIYNTAGRRVRFQKGAWIEPATANYPVLLVDTNNVAQLELALDQATLPEATVPYLIGVGGSELTGTGVDFNEDLDKLDTFNTSVRGLIWANATYVSLGSGSWPMVGSIVNRHIIVDNSVSIDDDPALQNAILPGFIGMGMRMVAGTYREANDYDTAITP